MTTPPTDEQLAAIEDRWTENGLIHGDIHALTQEARRLRERLGAQQLSDAYNIKALEERALRAEAEVERLRKDRVTLERDLTTLEQSFLRVEAERDRYAQALDEIIHMAEEPHLQIARAAEVAREALNQKDS